MEGRQYGIQQGAKIGLEVCNETKSSVFVISLLMHMAHNKV